MAILVFASAVAADGCVLHGPALLSAARNNSPEPLVWHLIEDFFEQGLVMKGFIGLGWLCMIIMIASIVFS